MDAGTMIKDRVIVMGLGKFFLNYKEEIYSRYEVVGVTSNNIKEQERFSDYIPLSQINDYEYDYILVCTASEFEIVNQLIEEKITEKNKIILASVILHRGIFHSQYNEDAVTLLLLKAIGMDCSAITYLELGTNHPVNLNNTYSLYLLGGRGMLVEPNRNLKNIIEMVRPQDILVNKAVSLDGKPAEFYDLRASELGTLSYDKLDKEFCKQYNNFDLKEMYAVETVTINDLFKSMGKIPEVLSLDIEGYDYAVLSQIDYECCRPIIIIVELAAWGAKEKERGKIEELLCRNGYLLFCENGTNGVFVDKKYEDMVKEYMI